MAAVLSRHSWDRLVALRRRRSYRNAATLGLVLLGPALAALTFAVMGPFAGATSGGRMLRLVLLADLLYLIVLTGLVVARMARIVAAGLMRCEALLEVLEDTEDALEAVRAIGTLGDTVSKLRAAAKSFMPEVSEQAVAIDTLKALAVWAGNAAPARGMVLAELLEGYATVRKLQIAAPLEELRARARAAGAVDSDKATGLSDESADAIRAKILGVDKK